MQRYFLHIAYDGTDFDGWQSQPGGNTVQDEINKALCTAIRTDHLETTGCGRTDAGVHASSFYLHCDLPQIIEDKARLLRSLNGILPSSIACFDVIAVHDSAHARFDATCRKYRYRIHQRKDPFLGKYSAQFLYNLDIDKMNDACVLLKEQQDFSAFQKSGSDNGTSICHLYQAEWLRKNAVEVEFVIAADRFLRNMVRSIVGTMLDVGRGKTDLKEFQRIMESGSRSESGSSVPACGLFLYEVQYPYISPENK
jgi:tRNA pseudouridine38-40 synthase